MEGWSTYRQNLEQDLKGLGTLLRAGFQEIAESRSADLLSLLHPHAGAESYRILNLACGQCDEAETLTRFVEEASLDTRDRLIIPGFARMDAVTNQVGGSKSIEVNLFGADIRAREISLAQDRFPKPKYQFLVEDCSRITQHHTLGSDFNLVFFRHQNFWNGRLLWTRIFQNALELCHPEGFVVMTSYFDREHLLAMETFQQSLGAQLLTTLKNPASRALVTPGKSIDRHLAIFSPTRTDAFLTQ